MSIIDEYFSGGGNGPDVKKQYNIGNLSVPVQVWEDDRNIKDNLAWIPDNTRPVKKFTNLTFHENPFSPKEQKELEIKFLKLTKTEMNFVDIIYQNNLKYFSNVPQHIAFNIAISMFLDIKKFAEQNIV